tara:strand:- start:373 stop:564 length:192 start_codon:yes stop_codon:yes gene_type:complete
MFNGRFAYYFGKLIVPIKKDYQVFHFHPPKILTRYSHIFIPSIPARKISPTKRVSLLQRLLQI